MTNSVPISDAAVKIGWLVFGLLLASAVILFVALANGWITLPVASSPTHGRGSGPFPWLLMGAVALLVILVDAALVLWIVRRRRTSGGR